MVNCFVVAFLIAVVVPSVLATPLSRDKRASLVTPRLISEIPSTRFKRSTSKDDLNLPDHLIFGVPVSKTGSDAILRLTRTPLLPTIAGDGWVDGVTDETAAIYTDNSRQSAMIIRRDDRDYRLQGTFHHSGEEWDIQPLSRNLGMLGSHQLAPLRAKEGQDIISFVGDEYSVGDNPVNQTIPQENASRRKRSAVRHYVEIAFVVDFEDFTKWGDFFGSSNAVREIQLWYTYVAESIRIRYETIQDSDIAITTRTTTLKILTTNSEDDFIQDLVSGGRFNGQSGLQAFRTWVGQQRDIPASDHYMLFTGFDIIGASGIAYGSAVCSAYSVSISENKFHASLGGIAAHELGHSLSANHDVRDGCNDGDQYVMSTILSTPISSRNTGNPWKFSPCSIAKFKSYLSGQTCTLAAQTSTTDVLPAPQDGQRAGETISLDDQCKRALQVVNTFFCTNVQTQQGGVETLCGGMYCSIPDNTGRCQTVLPQEYSPCGSQKWCVKGECVSSVAAPTTTTTTTQAPIPSGPASLFDCVQYMFNDWGKWWQCVREVFFYQRGLDQGQPENQQLGNRYKHHRRYQNRQLEKIINNRQMRNVNQIFKYLY